MKENCIDYFNEMSYILLIPIMTVFKSYSQPHPLRDP